MTHSRRYASTHTMNRRVFAVLVVVLAFVGAVTLPSGAQEDDELQSEELDEIRAERERNEQLLADAAWRIDGTLAEISDLTTAMDVVDQAINQQELEVKAARTKLGIAERRLAESTSAVEAAEAALVDLEIQVKRRAVESFVGQDVSTPDIVYTTNPALTVRMEALLTAVLQGDADVSESYSAVQNELAVERETARINRVAAEQLRVDVERVQRRLEADREIQLALFEASNERLEHLLNEQAYREQLGEDLEAKEKAELDKLAAQLRAASYTGPGGLAGPVATPDEIEWVYGIAIHKSIAANLEAMIEAAEADGIILRGAGWRDPSAQIRLRRAHCGTSDYAIWEAPASSCRPPTARPGSSYHEQGLAIDFTENGRSINSPNSPAYLWLRRNAANYGFYNLPTERWHWSTTGR
jgi:hypothetical protein